MGRRHRDVHAHVLVAAGAQSPTTLLLLPAHSVNHLSQSRTPKRCFQGGARLPHRRVRAHMRTCAHALFAPAAAGQAPARAAGGGEGRGASQ